MAFPNYVDPSVLYPYPDGWTNMGPLSPLVSEKVQVTAGTFWNSPTTALREVFLAHNICHSKLNFGREDGLMFRWCPECLVKVSMEESIEVIECTRSTGSFGAQGGYY